MKLVCYAENDVLSYGVHLEEKIISLPELANSLNEKLPKIFEDFIIQEGGIKKAEQMLEKADSNQLENASLSENQVNLQAPLVKPPKIICLGWNYIDHASETKTKVPAEPVIFMKPWTTIIGANQKIMKPQFVKELDYEGELAVVIGKKGKNIPESKAYNHVFGYTILNDVSARDFQFKDKQWTRGKGFDTFAPTGPCVVTENQIGDTKNLSIRTWVNDELRQNGSTRDMIFNIPQIIHHISRVMTLEPCDIISTGTPSGVGMALKPQKWLRHNDIVRIKIENIGVLENTVEEFFS